MDKIIKNKVGEGNTVIKLLLVKLTPSMFLFLCEVSGMSWRKIEGILVVGWGKAVDTPEW